jgi:hypothetical protein
MPQTFSLIPPSGPWAGRGGTARFASRLERQLTYHDRMVSADSCEWELPGSVTVARADESLLSCRSKENVMHFDMALNVENKRW